MSALFVVGAGTDIGKTFVTAGLVRYFRAQGREISALKPVASGFDPRDAAASDPGHLLAAMGRPLIETEIDRIAPFRFAAPLAPDMAARREGRSLRVADIATFCKARLESEPHPLLIESVGGVLSPIAEDATSLDLAAMLGLPLLLVTGSYLGAISHALTAVTAIHAANCSLSALVVNESADSAVPLAETRDTIARFWPRDTQRPALVTLTRHPDTAQWRALADALEEAGALTP